MSVQNMVLKSGATMAPTGGTDMTFAPDGLTIQNGVHLVVPAVTNYVVRPSATLKYKAPTAMPGGKYSRDKKSVSFNIPFVLADGSVSNQVIRIEREVHPEYSAAAALDLNVIASQLLSDSDMASFWSVGSIS